MSPPHWRRLAVAHAAVWLSVASLARAELAVDAGAAAPGNKAAAAPRARFPDAGSSASPPVASAPAPAGSTSAPPPAPTASPPPAPSASAAAPASPPGSPAPAPAPTGSPGPAVTTSGQPAPVTAPPAPPEPAPPPLADAPPGSSHARRKRYEGFYARIALGPGYANAKTDDSVDTRTITGAAASLSLSLGGRVSPYVAFGAAYRRDRLFAVRSRDEVLDGDEPDLTDTWFSIDRAGLFLELFPDPDGGWAIGGFLGYGDFNSHRPDGAEADDPSGWFLGLGVGHDWALSERWHAGVRVRLDYSAMTVDETGTGDRDVRLIAPALSASAAFY